MVLFPKVEVVVGLVILANGPVLLVVGLVKVDVVPVIGVLPVIDVLPPNGEEV